MKWTPLMVLGWANDDDRSIWWDLHRNAGWTVRAGLSLASATAILGLVLGLAGLIEMNSGRVDEQVLLLAVPIAIVAWSAILYWIWSGYRRWTRTLRTAVAIMAVWGVFILIAVILSEFGRRSELLIGACILLAWAATFLLISVASHAHKAGRSVTDRSGSVRVTCPRCGYSMVGLHSCDCPECGTRFTIDQLIEAQDYAALKQGAVADQRLDSRSCSGTVSQTRSVWSPEPLTSIDPSGEKAIANT
jgi:hypothetical protein